MAQAWAGHAGAAHTGGGSDRREPDSSRTRPQAGSEKVLTNLGFASFPGRSRRPLVGRAMFVETQTTST